MPFNETDAERAFYAQGRAERYLHHYQDERSRLPVPQPKDLPAEPQPKDLPAERQR